jgi:predicted regulator of Ras-like GTPase activity (Roadblock/LC7/MglB family)
VKSDVGQFFSAMREKLPGIRAFFLLDAGGELLAHVVQGPTIDVEVFAAEYAMLLRIAQSASRDSGMGDLEEQILTSATGIILLHRLPKNRFALFVCSPEEHLGRLRYELKRSLLYSTLLTL